VAKTPNFAVFWTLAFCFAVSTVGSNLKKLNMGAQLHNYPTASKIVSVLQCCHGEIVRTNSDVHKRDRQRNRQKNSTFLAAPEAGEIRASPNLAQ